MNRRLNTNPSLAPIRAARSLTLAALLCATPLSALAALTDIASVPLASSSTTVVKPNILFTLDDSGSMDREYMPDDISGRTGTTGFKNHLCNSIYYNPAITYVPPKNADGTNFSNASFTSAKTNGFSSSSGTTNLDTSFRANDSDTSQRAYYYVWSSGTAPSSGSTSNTTGCWPSSSSSFPHVTGNWTKKQVTSTSGPGLTDERTNFANWYAFYRTRLMMMKSATGRAFVGIGEGYRVGFITINPGSPVSSSKYLAINDFTATQKSAWFTKLYSISANDSTPLREALSRAGRHFAGIQNGINSGMSGDPMQYSCQQNFTILTTDGYWNGNAGDNLSGGAIGNHDGDISTNPRPMFDNTVTVTSTRSTKVDQFYSTSGCSSGRQRIRQTTTITTTPVSPSGSGTTDTESENVTSCVKTSALPPLQSPNPQTTTDTVTSTKGGATGTLADVAAYYYMTDLRAAGSTGALGTDVGTDNNVPSSGTGTEDDKAKHQHMTTFTMGLGLSGTLNYVPNYKVGAGGGDFAAIRTGTKAWPAPSADDPTALDDLWHAAVNGRGQFFSAADPDSVVDGLSTALAGVNARVASAAAAATSNLQPVAGDNYAYTASYKTQEWYGELEAKAIDLTTGAVGSVPNWTARSKLDDKTGAACDNRVIKLFRSGATSNLVNFTWNTQACDAAKLPTGATNTGLNAAEQAYFSSTQVALFSQFPDMTNGILPLLSVNQRGLAAGANMVNFLRGHRGREGFETNSQLLYRTRTSVLGDIVNAQPVFSRAPFADYQDTGYADFKASNANRTPMVYSAANDGMLHAFYAGSNTSDPLGGQERWAFIPTMVLPNLYKLADNNYSTQHVFSVDGTPTITDVFDPSASPTAPNYGWKTILVGGLNAGGKGYYALDVTDPANPKGLWEFKHSTTCLSPVVGQSSDCHLGYSYGTPQIGKLADGRWVVFVTSGYNNVNSPSVTGDGIGYLYVLNALNGQIIYKISTGAGSAATPSGLGKTNVFVLDGLLNNTVQHLYGVDLSGNVWRFAVNGSQTATLLATLTDASNNPQPITIKPELAEFGSPPIPHIFVATGKYVGASDLSSTQTQTVWALKDNGTYPIATPRSTLSRLTITNAGNGESRNIGCAANCTNNGGWFADLPDSGERVNVDMKLQLGTLTVTSNVPQNSACNIGGYSWLNFFDARNGLQIAGSQNFGSKLSDSLSVGINVIRLPDGRTVVIATTSDASQITAEAPIPAGDPQGRRTSWRELVQ